MQNIILEHTETHVHTHMHTHTYTNIHTNTRTHTHMPVHAITHSAYCHMYSVLFTVNILSRLKSRTLTHTHACAHACTHAHILLTVICVPRQRVVMPELTFVCIVRKCSQTPWVRVPPNSGQTPVMSALFRQSSPHPHR